MAVSIGVLLLGTELRPGRAANTCLFGCEPSFSGRATSAAQRHALSTAGPPSSPTGHRKDVLSSPAWEDTDIKFAILKWVALPLSPVLEVVRTGNPERLESCRYDTEELARQEASEGRMEGVHTAPSCLPREGVGRTTRSQLCVSRLRVSCFWQSHCCLGTYMRVTSVVAGPALDPTQTCVMSKPVPHLGF